MQILTNYAIQTIQDKLSGGAVLGLYNNLLNVLDNALPSLINDYGYVTEQANNENNDDYGKKNRVTKFFVFEYVD